MADETVDTPTQEEAMSAYQELLNLAPEVEMADPREGTYNGVQIKGAEADFAGSVPRVKITFTGMTDQEDKDFEHTASFSSVVQGDAPGTMAGAALEYRDCPTPQDQRAGESQSHLSLSGGRGCSSRL